MGWRGKKHDFRLILTGHMGWIYASFLMGGDGPSCSPLSSATARTSKEKKTTTQPKDFAKKTLNTRCRMQSGLLLRDHTVEPKSPSRGTQPLRMKISPSLHCPHLPERGETDAELWPNYLPSGIEAGRNKWSRRKKSPALQMATLRPEQSATERLKSAANEGAVVLPQHVTEDKHTSEQLQLPRILCRRPVSDTTVDLRKVGTDSPTGSLPPPRRQRAQREHASIFTRTDRHTTLLEEPSLDPPPPAIILHG